VFTLIGWERREVKEAGGFVGTLESATKMPYLELATETSKVVILFDEAQDSYWDEELWLEFFKALELGMGPIVILFASFGADQRTPVGTINTGTHLVMMPQMRIGLYPSAGSRVGLLMGENKAKELVTRKLAVMSSHEMVVDERLMRDLYLITDGHRGALSSLSEELYDVCLMLPMSMIVFGVATVTETNLIVHRRSKAKHVGILISLMMMVLKSYSQNPFDWQRISNRPNLVGAFMRTKTPLRTTCSK